MASVMTNLDAVVQEYLQDTEFQQEWQVVAKQRRASIPRYQPTVSKFIDGTYTLHEFRNALKTLHQDKSWGASSPGFLMVLNQLANNHVPTNPDIEANFRFILRDLNTQNVGQRIEQFIISSPKRKNVWKHPVYRIEKLPHLAKAHLSSHCLLYSSTIQPNSMSVTLVSVRGFSFFSMRNYC